MTKKIIVLVALALLVLATGAFGPSAKADGTGRAVVMDFGCTLLDGDGRVGSIATKSQAVISNDANGKSKMTCRGEVTPSTTSKGAVTWDFANTGFLCGIGDSSLLTEDWKEVVTPSGEAVLSCHFNPKKD